MTRSRPVRPVAVAAAVAALVALPGVSAAAVHHPATAKPKTGLLIKGEPRITTNTKPADYYIDPHGHEHFVQFRSGSSAGTGKVVYYSRRLGAKKWSIHAAPGDFNTSGHPQLQIIPNPHNTRQFFVVADTCGGDYAVLGTDSTPYLAQFTQVTATSDCAASSSPRRLAEASLYLSDVGYGVEAVVPDGTVPGQWDVMAGTPGGTFKQIETVPTTNHFVPTQFTTGIGGQLTLIGHGIDASNSRGVFAINLASYDVSDNPPSHWSAMTEIATLGSPTKDYIVDSASSFGDRLSVGLFEAPGTAKGQAHTLFVDTRDSSGQWSSPIAIAHSGLHDRNLVLSTNGTTRKLRATWQRLISSPVKARRSNSGIISQRLLTSGWTKAAFVTHWYHDRPLAVTYDPKTIPHFLYQQSR